MRFSTNAICVISIFIISILLLQVQYKAEKPVKPDQQVATNYSNSLITNVHIVNHVKKVNQLLKNNKSSNDHFFG